MMTDCRKEWAKNSKSEGKRYCKVTVPAGIRTWVSSSDTGRRRPPLDVVPSGRGGGYVALREVREGNFRPTYPGSATQIRGTLRMLERSRLR